MFRGRGLLRIVLAALLIGGLLSLGSYFGWAHGYNAGLIAADGGAQPLGPYPYPHYGFGFFPFFFGFGLIFKIGFLFLIFMVFGRLFRFGWGGLAGGPRGGYDSRVWRHDPPPWGKERRRPGADAEPDDEVKSY